MPMLSSHSLWVRGVVEVNSPPNCTITYCITRVNTMIPMKVVFLKNPANTFISVEKGKFVEIDSKGRGKRGR